MDRTERATTMQKSIYNTFSFYANPNKQQIYNIQDLASNLEDVPKLSEKKSILQSSIKYAEIIYHAEFKFLILLPIIGILTGITVFFIDYASMKLYNFRVELSMMYTGLTSFLIFFITGWIISTIGIYLTISYDDMESSAVPELKTILSGVNIIKYMRGQIFFPKMFGFIACVTCGLSLGRDGPFIHFSCIIANTLCKKIKYFNEFIKSNTLRKKVLSACSASGLCATTGTAFGGVLYSLELTSSHFLISNLWRCFYCAMWTMLTNKLLKKWLGINDISLKFADIDMGFELVNFVGLGIICGIMGGLYNKMVARFCFFRRNWNLYIFDRFYYTWICYGLVTIITWFFPAMMTLDRTLNFQLQSKEDLSQLASWEGINVHLYLIIICIIKYIFCILFAFVTMPLGVGSTIAVCGSTVGRLYGEILHNVVSSGINPRNYALIGGVGTVQGMSRTIANAVIILEVYGCINLMIPLMIGATASIAIANSMSLSIFDVWLVLRKLPYVPPLANHKLYQKTVDTIMNTQFPKLAIDAKHIDLYKVITEMEKINKEAKVAIIERDDTLVGAVKMGDLIKYLEHAFNEFKANYRVKDEKLEEMDRFFEKAKTVYEQEPNPEGDIKEIRLQRLNSKMFKLGSEYQPPPPIMVDKPSEIEMQPPRPSAPYDTLSEKQSSNHPTLLKKLENIRNNIKKKTVTIIDERTRNTKDSNEEANNIQSSESSKDYRPLSIPNSQERGSSFGSTTSPKLYEKYQPNDEDMFSILEDGETPANKIKQRSPKLSKITLSLPKTNYLEVIRPTINNMSRIEIERLMTLAVLRESLNNHILSVDSPTSAMKRRRDNNNKTSDDARFKSNIEMPYLLKDFSEKFNKKSQLRTVINNIGRKITSDNDRKRTEIEIVTFLKFWEENIDFNAKELMFDASPITITAKFWVSKLHFLYAMSGATTIFIKHKTKVIGKISKDEFLKLKREYIAWEQSQQQGSHRTIFLPIRC